MADAGLAGAGLESRAPRTRPASGQTRAHMLCSAARCREVCHHARRQPARMRRGCGQGLWATEHTEGPPAPRNDGTERPHSQNLGPQDFWDSVVSIPEDVLSRVLASRDGECDGGEESRCGLSRKEPQGTRDLPDCRAGHCAAARPQRPASPVQGRQRCPCCRWARQLRGPAHAAT